ncbi:MAG: MFS transporter [bacterium]|nr:MFS transporter [bacterium]
MERNIRIAYILAFFKNSWFWLGIWVFYYLRFTNYAGIGIIETVHIGFTTLSEIPTGAFADLLGKKYTLMIAFFFMAIGLVFIAIAQGLPHLIIGVILAGIGMAFYSGTYDALIYDSLIEEKKQDTYPKIISNIGTISLLTPAICGILGGYMYTLNPSLPFFGSAIMYTLGCGFSLFLKEPKVDTVKFNFNNFLTQTKQGFHQLFKTRELVEQTILLLSVATIIVIADEMLNGILGFEFGFNGIQLSYLFAGIYIISSLVSQLTPFLLKRYGERVSLIFTGSILAVTFVMSPFAGLALGGISLFLRNATQIMYGNISSVAINKTTESRYRATTLSTYNMFKNIPYVILAFFIGSLADVYSAKTVAFWLGIATFLFVIGHIFLSLKPKKPIPITQ